MHKFNTGDRVLITEGVYAGQYAAVMKVDDGGLLADSSFVPEYVVISTEHPYGTSVLETQLTEAPSPPNDNWALYKESFGSEEVPFCEMSSVGGGFDSIKLAVWGSEGNIPHFHFYKGVSPNKGVKNKGRGGGCICFLKNVYFNHGSHKDTLSSQEIEDLIEFLKSELDHRNITVWDYMIMLWNDNNPNQTQIPWDAKIPEYKSDMETFSNSKG